MQYNNIYEANLDNYKPMIWKDGPIFNRYKFITNYLSEELGEEYSRLLSMPKIKGDYGVWMSQILSTNIVSLERLSDKEGNEIIGQLQIKLDKIDTLIASLKAKRDQSSKDLGELLEIAFLIPDKNHIIIDLSTREFCLVAWGFAYSDLSLGKGTRLKLTQEVSPHLSSIGLNKESIEDPDFGRQDEFAEDLILDMEDQTANSIKSTPFVPLSNDSRTEEGIINSGEEGETFKEGKKKNNRLVIALSILLFFALIAILSLIFYKPAPKDNFAEILPEQPNQLPPIDTSKIIVDQSDPLKQRIISNRLNIYLTPGTDIKTFSLELKKKYPNPNTKIVYYTSASNRLMIEFPPSERTKIKQELADEFRNVEFVMDETIFEKNKTPPPFNDPGLQENTKAWPLERIQAFDAWKVTKGDPNITIAVIDDGFDLSHTELQGRSIHPWDIPSNNSKPNTGLVSMFHGTHVAGIAGAKSNNLEGIAGIAPECKIMPIQVGSRYGFMTTSAIVDGLFYALNHKANVINLSLGSSFMDNLKGIDLKEQQKLSKTLYKNQAKFWNKIFKLFYEKGIVVVQAAGNANLLASIDPMQRNPYTIKVSATNSQNRKAPFSNFGTSCKLSAPGTNIYSAFPNQQYKYLDGTSMAAPMVSGAVALLKSVNPNISPTECINTLYQTGLKTGPDIGPLIQLADALGYKGKDQLPCQEEIEDLREELQKLKKRFPDSSSYGLVIPRNPKDLSFAEGLWKSTTDLFSSLNEEKVELYFQFYKNSSGRLTILEERGRECTALLNVQFSPNKLEISQKNPASCEKGISYDPYSIRCISTGNQIANCTAVNNVTLQEVEFQLVKVNSF